ncbi:hypothetical protein V5P93_004891 [Actinokineospora auranticolor]|uniref:hypothetical protein n=1 Tax=Actinokineospora auranticolor TaxID=155976 RepID=UPI0011B0BE74|nr:hypothetical protein [Actinokineospora auranticolor]
MLLLGAITLAVALAVSVRRRGQVAPVVRTVFYAASVMSGAGMILSVLSWPPALQRGGAIAAVSGLLVVGLITRGVDRATRRLTFVATSFLGLSCAASAVWTDDSASRWFLLRFAAVLLFIAWKSRSGGRNWATLAVVLLAVVASIGLPMRSDAPVGAAVLVFACGLAGLVARDDRLRPLVTIFGFCGAILAYVLIQGQHATLNGALVGVAVSAVGWSVATRRGRDDLALAALVVFALCTVVVGVTMAWSTTLGLGCAYLATAVAALLNGVLVWLPRLPVARARWKYFLTGPDNGGDVPVAVVRGGPEDQCH